MKFKLAAILTAVTAALAVGAPLWAAEEAASFYAWQSGLNGRPSFGAGRLGLELNFGKTASSPSINWHSAVIRLSLPIVNRLRIDAAMPFFGYKGEIGEDNFIRGNIKATAAFEFYQSSRWLLYLEGSVYFPTFEDSGGGGLFYPIDLRQSALSHLLCEPGFGFGKFYSIQAAVGGRYIFSDLLISLRIGNETLPERGESAAILEAEVLYDVYAGLMFGAHWASLFDLKGDASYTKHFLGYLRDWDAAIDKALHKISFEAEYVGKTGKIGLNFNVPVGASYREIHSWFMSVNGAVWLP